MLFVCRYVKTTANATVDHLSKYLALRIALEDSRTNGETEDRGGGEGGGGGGGGEERAATGGGETDGPAGGGEGSSLTSISEKQYTIYILTRGGQFSVSNETNTAKHCIGVEENQHGSVPPDVRWVN